MKIVSKIFEVIFFMFWGILIITILIIVAPFVIFYDRIYMRKHYTTRLDSHGHYIKAFTQEYKDKHGYI